LNGGLLFLFLSWQSLTLAQGWLTREILKVSQKTYEASERPYIGVENIPSGYVSKDKDGELKSVPKPEKDAFLTQFQFSAQIKNFGPVPGRNCAAHARAFWNDKEVPSAKRFSDTPTTIFPTEVVNIPGHIENSSVDSLVRGTGILELEIAIDYDTTTSHDHSCTKYRYSSDDGGFALLGNCTH
jgi:hypothetical protein